MKKQTAGYDNFGEIAPKFAELNDDVLFGEVWSREKQLSPKERSLITCSSLLTQGMLMLPQLKAHFEIAKGNGVTKEEMVEVVTQLAFYAGWPKALSAMNLIKEIY